MTRTSLVGWLMLATFCLALASVAAPKFMVTGYVQGRAGDRIGSQGSPAVSTFELRRAYMYVRASVDEHVTGALLLAMQPTTRVEHAYAEYAAKPHMVRLGLVPLPIGYEIPLSSSRLVTLERSQIVSDLIVKSAGAEIYFFDRGLFYYYGTGKGINVAVAAVNGRPVENAGANEGTLTKDNNDGKPIVGRVGYSLKGGEVGASIYTGTRTVGGANSKLTLYAADLALNRAPFTLIAEAMKAKDGGVDKNGGYVTVAYRPADWNLQPYARVDVEDANADTPNNSYSRLTLGTAYFLNPTSKVSLEYETIDAGANFAGGAAANGGQPNGRLTGQFQVIF
jgi:hypothetical protein